MKKIQKRRKVINVTKRDIKLGEKDSPESCPVARAVARSFHKKIGTYEVYADSITFPGHREVKAPKSVQNFVQTFDDDQRITNPNPFTFTLEY